MVALAVTGLTAPARAETYTAGLFEDFQNGSIDGQQGWTNPGPEDVAIVTPASARNLGVHALRLSNAVAADQPTSHAFSPHLSEVAGESGAVHRHFDTSFLFTSADPSNVQTGLVVAVAPAGPDGRPISLIRIYDKPDGLDVTLTSADTAGQLHEESIAQGLVRSQLHSVSLSVDFAPGAANDFVSARVDDPNFPIVTRASWEEYYRQTAQSEPPKVDSLVFLPTLPIQPGLPAMPPQPGLSGRGLLIDQLPGTNAPPFVRTSGNVTPGQLGMCDVEFDSVEQSVNLSLDCQTPQPLTIPDNWTLDGSGHILFAENPTGGTFTGAIVKSGGATMGVRNITITAKDMVGRSGILDGIRFQNSGGSVQDVTVSNITHGTGADEGRAIVADNRGGVGRPTVTVEDADIVNYQKAGVVALGNVDLNLRNSAISSAGDLGVAADAVRLSDGATGEIVGNSIVGNEWNGTAAVAASAIAVSGDAIAEINRNLISGTGTDV